MPQPMHALFAPPAPAVASRAATGHPDARPDAHTVPDGRVAVLLAADAEVGVLAAGGYWDLAHF